MIIGFSDVLATILTGGFWIIALRIKEKRIKEELQNNLDENREYAIILIDTVIKIAEEDYAKGRKSMKESTDIMGKLMAAKNKINEIKC